MIMMMSMILIMMIRLKMFFCHDIKDNDDVENGSLNRNVFLAPHFTVTHSLSGSWFCTSVASRLASSFSSSDICDISSGGWKEDRRLFD